jgi:hypothetical protein
MNTGIALVTNNQAGLACSGALIAADLIITAKHCAFGRDAAGDIPLEVAGFRVGFGTTEDSLLEREVDRLAWVGMPNDLSIDAAVAAGEDVAVLHLSQPAPSGETVRDIALNVEFSAGEGVQVAGFGVTSLSSAASGVRGAADGQVSGFDPGTGIVAISGPGVCFGDSGGPVFSRDGLTILGVLGQLGGGDAGFCSEGLSFANTAANVRVQRLLAKECASLGGCGPRPIQIGNFGGAAGSSDAGSGGLIDSSAVGGADDGGASSLDGGLPGGSASEANTGCEISTHSSRHLFPELLGAMAGMTLVASRIGKRRARRGL